MQLRNVILAAVALATAAFAQPNATLDTPFHVRYAANLTIGESYINITNDGANGCALMGPDFGTQYGSICVNVYGFDQHEELVACCSCFVTCDQTSSLGVRADLALHTLTGVVPTNMTVKLLATLAGANGSGTASSCNNSAALVGTANTIPAGANGSIVSGLTAWGTTLHVYSFVNTANPLNGTFFSTETPFTPATLSTPGTLAAPVVSELASIGNRCANIIGNGSGFGQCNSCRPGAVGGSKSGQ